MKTPEEWNWEHTQICATDPAVHGQLLPTPQMVKFIARVQADALKEAAKIVEDKCSWTEGEQRFFGGINVLEAHTEITVRAAAHQNAELSEQPRENL